MRRAVVVIPKMLGSCKECGCQCSSCNSNSLDLHHEVEELRSRLNESVSRVAQLETQCAEGRSAFDGEVSRLSEDLAKLRERYDRLLENNRKLQKVNHDLEDKLLRVVNHFDLEKTTLQSEISVTTAKLVDAKSTIVDLQRESERYKNDCALAVHLLKTNPSQYLETAGNILPKGVYEKLRASATPPSLSDGEEDDDSSSGGTSMTSARADMPRTVHMPTFPPTAFAFASASSSLPSSPRLTTQSRRRRLALTALVNSYVAPNSPSGDTARRLFVCPRCQQDSVWCTTGSQTNE